MNSQPDSWKAKALSGVFWIGAAKVCIELSRLGKFILLARLLPPAYFGHIAIALFVVGAFEAVTESGFSAALLQRKELSPRLLNTAFTAQFLRGAVLSLLIMITSPRIAEFFTIPESGSLLQFMAILLFMRGMLNPAIVVLSRDLSFKQLVAWLVAEPGVDLIVSVAAAVAYKSPWAIAWGLAAGQGARVLLSYVLSSYRPRLSIHRPELGELFAFGRWMTLSSIAVFMSAQVDKAVLGKVANATTLGLYQIALRISELPRSLFNEVAAHVALPLFARMRETPTELLKAWRRSLWITLVTSSAVAAVLITLVSNLIPMVLGPTWQPASRMLVILSVAMVARSVSALPGYYFTAVGKPSLTTVLAAVRLIVLVATIWPLWLHGGAEGICIAVTVSNIAMVPVAFVCSWAIRRQATRLCQPLNVPACEDPAD